MIVSIMLNESRNIYKRLANKMRLKFNKLNKKNVIITKFHMRLHIVYDPFDFKKRNFVSFYAAISWLKRYGNKNRFYQLDNILFVKVMNNKVYKYDFVNGISTYIY